MSFCENSDVREFSTFDDTNIVKEVTITQARLKAERLIRKSLTPTYLAKVDAGTLTTDETFDLKVGETEIATAILCKAYALRYTMYKYNRSISTGSIGGESDRDSVKNLDFLEKMYPAFWMEGWGCIAEYITAIPNFGTITGLLDPYSTFGFKVVQNHNLDGHHHHHHCDDDDDDLGLTDEDLLNFITDGSNFIEWG